MNRPLLFVTILIVIAHAAPLIKSFDQMKQDMIAAGVSEETADGLIDRGKEYMRDHISDLINFNQQSLMKTAFGLTSVWDDYLKTRSEEDQKAFETYSINVAAESMQNLMDMMSNKN